MKITAYITLVAGLAAVLGLPAHAAPPVPDVVGQGRRLAGELGKPQYARSRCLLAPILADNGRIIAESKDGAFAGGDVILAVDGEALDAAGGTTLVQLLEQRPPGGMIEIRLARAGVEHNVSTRCTDAKPYYERLTEAARAAAEDDGKVCAKSLAEAARLHDLASVYLRLQLSCRIKAGLLSGAAVWRAEYELYRRRILEAQYTESELEGIRHAVLAAARDLQNNGQAGLAAQLRTQYSTAAER